MFPGESTERDRGRFEDEGADDDLLDEIATVLRPPLDRLDLLGG